MKKFAICVMALAVVCWAAVSVLADDAKAKNLLTSKWRIYGSNKNTVIDKDGVIACVSKGKSKKDVSGVMQNVILNQKEANPITFSAESKCEDVTGKPAPTYSIYLDIKHTDGTSTFGRIVTFKTGTHDWEKAEKTYTPKKPIKRLNYLLLFRYRPGKVWFRNAALTEGK